MGRLGTGVNSLANEKVCVDNTYGFYFNKY